MKYTTNPTKQLKTHTTRYGDYTEVVERFGVYDRAGQRVGTVHKYSGHSGPAFFDPYVGAGNGKLVVQDFEICRCRTFRDAVAVVFSNQ